MSSSQNTIPLPPALPSADSLAKYVLKLPRPLHAQLKRIAADRGITLGAVLLAAAEEVARQYSESTESDPEQP